jgi:hypothetical protein
MEIRDNLLPGYIRSQIYTYGKARVLKGVNWYACALYNTKDGTEADYRLVERIKQAIVTDTSLPTDIEDILD